MLKKRKWTYCLQYCEDRVIATGFGKGKNLEFRTANCTRKVHSGRGQSEAHQSWRGRGTALLGSCSAPCLGQGDQPSCLSISLATPTTLEPSFLLFLYGFYIHRVRGVLRRPREAVGMFSLDYQNGHLS